MTKKATAVKGRSLRQILLRRILALSAVTLIILSGIMTMLLCVSSYRSNYTEAAAAIEYAGSNLDLLSDSLNNISSMVAYSSITQEALSTHKRDGGGQDMKGLHTLFSSTAQYIRFIDNLILLDGDLNYFTSMFILPETQKEALCAFVRQLPEEKKNGRVTWYILRDGEKEQAFLMRAIYGMNSVSLDYIGYLMITLNIQAIYAMVKEAHFTDVSELLLVDANGTVLYDGGGMSGDRDMSTVLHAPASCGYRKVENRPVLAAHSDVLRNGWVLVELTPQYMLFRAAWYSLGWMILLFGVVTLISSVALLLISRSITAPFERMQQSMRQIERGDFNVPAIPAVGILEIDELLLRFEEMAERLNDTIEEVYYAKLRETELTMCAQQSEIEMLQQQINPHFLYNTLDSINWMASMGATEEVSHMIIALSNFFRFTVSEHSAFTTIEREVVFAENYVYLQKRRFGSALSVEFHVAPEVGKYLTLRLLLQPLIENAILHGTMRGGRSGVICVEIGLNKGRIRLSVKDNGIGMDKDTIKRILDQRGKRSIGLPNIMRRLELVFKEQYFFDIQSAPMDGTQILIEFPAVGNEEELNRLTKKKR